MTDPNTPPEPQAVVAAVRAALTKVLAPEDLGGIDVDTVDSATPILSLPVDSAVLMALMTELEDTFGVFIEEEAAFAFVDVGDIADYIRHRFALRAQRQGGV